MGLQALKPPGAKALANLSLDVSAEAPTHKHTESPVLTGGIMIWKKDW
jgi:hypothetical protein